jgi:hypothetical protein
MTKPTCYPATLEKLDSKNAYILDNGDYLYLYLGNQVSDTFIYNVRVYANLFNIGVWVC